MQLYAILQKSSSWDDIHFALSPSPKSGKLFEEFCKYYFLAEPSVKDEYNNVWLFDEVPQEIKKRLNLGVIDHGVDLVLADKDDKYTVVQCKYRANQDSILSWSKDKLANLLADGEKAEYKIIFTNASGLDQHTLSKQIELLSLGDLLSIEESTISAIRNLSEGKIQSVSAKAQPRDYQINILETVYNQFQSDDRGQLILPCGAGKTLTSLWIKEKLNSKHTIVVVPSLALLRQTKYEWSKNQSEWQHYLCVCSEKDIDQNNADMPIVHPYELGTHVTTDSNEIKDFFRKYSDTGTIIYSTYQSLAVVAEAVQGLDFSFDLLIADEAHKTTGNTTTVFGLVHDNNQIPANKRLYMTATPRVLSPYLKNKLASENEYIADMSNSLIYGDEFYRMSFKDAIDKGILVDYQIVVVGVSDEEIKEAIDTRKFVSDKQETIEDIAHNYALEKIMCKYNATHAITFHSSIKRAERFKLRHKKIVAGSYTEHVSGKQTTNHRAKVLDSFKRAQKGVISNARCLTEGIDLPAIDVVYFCDPKSSKVDIVQAVGRALRHSKTKQKEYGYVVVPVFYHHTDNIEKTIDSSEFQHLVNVIRAMCDQDERLQDEINTIKTGKGAKKNNLNHVSVDIENINDILIIDNFEEKLKQSLFDEIINKTASSWEVRYNELCGYIEQHGGIINSRIQGRANSLYTWLRNQQIKYKNNKLTQEHINKLISVGIALDNDEEKQGWEESYEEFEKYLKNTNKYPTLGTNSKLNRWVQHQREAKKKGILSISRINKLNELDFIWDYKDFSWNSKYDELKNSIKSSKMHELYSLLREKGYENAKKEWLLKGYNKTDWYKQCENLKLIGVSPHFLRGSKIEFETLTRGKDDYPQNTKVYREGKTNPLYTWIKRQKNKFKTGELADEQIEKLKILGIKLD